MLMIEPDGPCAVEVLSNEDGFAGVAEFSGSWGDIQDMAAESYGVVVSDHGLVGETDQEVSVPGADGPEGGLVDCGLQGKPLVMSIDEGVFQPGIGGFDVLDPFQCHFGQKPVL